MFCCALSYTNSEESFLIKEASVVGLCRGSIQSGVILVQAMICSALLKFRIRISCTPLLEYAMLLRGRKHEI